jgi:hypothetical protein
MLAQEFWALTRNEWSLYPEIGFGRLTDGTIRHSTTEDPASFQDAMRIDLVAEPPVKIQEDAGRDTVINCQNDQARLLQYCAWARQSIAVSIALPIDNHNTEYWMNFEAQKPPNSLDRMHASLPKQIAYNQRVLKAGEEVDRINCDLADFLSEMIPDPSEPVIVCVNAGVSMKRHEQHLGGQR